MKEMTKCLLDLRIHINPHLVVPSNLKRRTAHQTEKLTHHRHKMADAHNPSFAKTHPAGFKSSADLTALASNRQQAARRPSTVEGSHGAAGGDGGFGHRDTRMAAGPGFGVPSAPSRPFR